MARLYIIVPGEALAEDEREAVTTAILGSFGSRFSGTGLIGPNSDLEYFEVDVENDDEGGAAIALRWPKCRLLAYARAAEHEDAVAGLAGIQLADHRVNIRAAIEGE